MFTHWKRAYETKKTKQIGLWQRRCILSSRRKTSPITHSGPRHRRRRLILLSDRRILPWRWTEAPPSGLSRGFSRKFRRCLWIVALRLPPTAWRLLPWMWHLLLLSLRLRSGMKVMMRLWRSRRWIVIMIGLSQFRLWIRRKWFGLILIGTVCFWRISLIWLALLWLCRGWLSLSFEIDWCTVFWWIWDLKCWTLMMFWSEIQELSLFLWKRTCFSHFCVRDCRSLLRSPKVQSSQPITVGKHRAHSNLACKLRAKVASVQAVYRFYYIHYLSLLSSLSSYLVIVSMAFVRCFPFDVGRSFEQPLVYEKDLAREVKFVKKTWNISWCCFPVFSCGERWYIVLGGGWCYFFRSQILWTPKF